MTSFSSLTVICTAKNPAVELNTLRGTKTTLTITPVIFIWEFSPRGGGSAYKNITFEKEAERATLIYVTWYIRFLTTPSSHLPGTPRILILEW